MKIAHIITRLIIGGAQENTLLTCEGLTKRGHEVTLIAGPETGPEGSLWTQAESSAGRLVRVDSLRRNIHPLLDARCARDLLRMFRREGFHVVHTHSSKAGIIGRYAAHRAGVPTVVHTIHGMSFNRTQPAAVRRLYATLERQAARWSHGIICVADAMIEQSVAARIADRPLFTTIRSGMRTQLYRPDPAVRTAKRAEWGLGADEVVIGTVARLFRNKGYEHLLLALPRIVAGCPAARFVWVGDGPNRAEYLGQLERLGLRDRVHLTGLVPPAEIPDIMNGLDVLAHASLWEGLPRAVVQASLTGVPVVSFDNDGAPEAVLDGETGFLAKVGDADALSRGVIALCQDRGRRERMGRRAREHCLERFDHELMVEEIEALYRRLCGEVRV